MEVSILQFLEKLRTPAATFLAGIFSLFGETLVLVALISVVYWLVDKRLGEQLVFVSFSSMSVNAFLKGTVSRLRPYAKGVVSRVEIDTPFLSTMNLEEAMSFPSGHAQMSAGLFFTSAFRIKKKWAWGARARVDAARHGVAALLRRALSLGRISGRGVRNRLRLLLADGLSKSLRKALRFCGILRALSLALLAIAPNKSLSELSGCMCAAAIAAPIEQKFVGFQIRKGALRKLFRALVGFACVGVVFALSAALPWSFLWLKWIKYFLLVLTAALLVPFLFVKLKI